MKRITISIACSTLLCLTACLTEISAHDKETEPDLTVRIRISFQNNSNTKAQGPFIDTGTPLSFKDGYLFFTEADGTIAYRVSVTQGVGTSTQISIDDLTSSSGVVMEDVPEETEEIYFVGNLPAGTSVPDLGTNITTFLSGWLPVTSQYDTGGNISLVGMYGTGSIDRISAINQAKLTVKAIASRIELHQFTPNSNIDYFDVEGIFINNFYTRAHPDGIPDQLIYYTATANFEENGEMWYSTAQKEALFDFSKTYIGEWDSGNVHYIPLDQNEVWAYNIFSGVVPHVVIRLSNVRASSQYLIDNNYATDPFQERENWYITVKGLRSSTTGQLLSALDNGYSYTIKDIPVTPENLNPIPEPKDEVEVQVQINLMLWEQVSVDPELPQLPW